MSRVVILGDSDDLHIQAVQRQLLKAGCDFTNLGVGDNFGLVAFDIAGGALRLRLNGGWLRPDEVTAVWDRARASMPVLKDEAWQYVFRERQAFIESLQAFSPEARWMNPVQTSKLAANKIAQLLAARRAGFSIPETLVTNDPAAVTALAQETGWQLVFKALSWLATSEGEVLYTTELTPLMGEQLQAGLRPAPCIFQRRVPKDYELRVTAVDGSFFAARIGSQEQDATSLDWRREQLRLSYGVEDMPAELADRLTRILSALNLKFGAFDLAVTASGDVVFFEVNPTGNWLWLEERLDLPISEQIAGWLARPG